MRKAKVGYSHTSDEDLNQEAAEEAFGGILFQNLCHVVRCHTDFER